ncbi:hypothetical protein BH10PLA1_BH10PLA1_06770 [soil metagenome]
MSTAMKSGLASFVAALAASLAGVWIIGPNLGGAFWIVCVVSILSPVAASSFNDMLPSLIAGVCASVGGAVAATMLLMHDAFTLEQSIAVAGTAFAIGLALLALVRLLVVIRIAPILAAFIVTLLALAWLSWPLWLSPWLTFPESGDVASRLASVHPLMSINAVAQQFGFWTQGKIIYRLTTVGQNFQIALPSGVMRCVSFHLVVATLAVAPLAISATITRRKSARLP